MAAVLLVACAFAALLLTTRQLSLTDCQFETAV
jgi:hypothetical protein